VTRDQHSKTEQQHRNPSAKAAWQRPALHRTDAREAQGSPGPTMDSPVTTS